MYAVSLMYLYNQRFNNELFCKLNAAEKICSENLLSKYGIVQKDVILRSYPCNLIADDIGTFVLDSSHSPCYIEFNAPIFIEEFNLNSQPTPDNFVYLNNEQIPFQSKVEFATWQSLKSENAIAPGSQSLIHSRKIIYSNSTIQFYSQTARLRLRILEKVSPLQRLI